MISLNDVTFSIISPVLTPVNSNLNIIEIRIFNRQSVFIPISDLFIKIKEFKEIINNFLEYTSKEFDLSFNSIYLDDNKYLNDYNINYKSIIYITFRSHIYKNIKNLETNDEYFIIDIT